MNERTNPSIHPSRKKERKNGYSIRMTRLSIGASGSGGVVVSHRIAMPATPFLWIETIVSTYWFYAPLSLSTTLTTQHRRPWFCRATRGGLDGCLDVLPLCYCVGALWIDLQDKRRFSGHCPSFAGTTNYVAYSMRAFIAWEQRCRCCMDEGGGAGLLYLPPNYPSVIGTWKPPTPSFDNPRDLDNLNHSIDWCLRRSERGTNKENGEEEIGRVWISPLLKIGVCQTLRTLWFSSPDENWTTYMLACLPSMSQKNIIKCPWSMKDVSFSIDELVDGFRDCKCCASMKWWRNE